MSFQRNNLHSSRSPYLRQHADNPVWWQEWNEQTLQHARQTHRPLFVSVGYSTCHWCHVMAGDAFSDSRCAEYLNEHFIAIKVDREQRPDIDHYLMTFLVATTGSGGWPLNAFLTPSGNPFFAMTYAGSEPRFNLPGFKEILERVVAFYRDHEQEIQPFELPAEESRSWTIPSGGNVRDEPFLVPIRDEDAGEVSQVISKLSTQFDETNAGFGNGAKFPPHAPLLFLQYAGAAGFHGECDKPVIRTLDIMQQRGLHDHLQGGFFRYTVDRNWTVPHFEKMLYDQALLLWNYSLAAKRFSRQDYRQTAAGIFRSLEDTFVVDGLYASGHDADTEHHEGETYLWTTAELERLLNNEQLTLLRHHYDIREQGNFEGAIHLVGNDRSDLSTLAGVHEILLKARRRRIQPARDDKIVVSWNALAAIALFTADRHAGVLNAGSRATEITDLLVDRFVEGSRVAHGSFEGAIDQNQFLSDHAAMLLLITFAREQNNTLSDRYSGVESSLAEGLSQFIDNGIWVENRTPDLAPLPADPYDQPVPSSISMAEFGLLRRAMSAHQEHGPAPFGTAQGRAFANISAMASRGYLWVVESPERHPWNAMPINSLVVSGEHRMSCYRGVCYLGPPPDSATGHDSAQGK